MKSVLGFWNQVKNTLYVNGNPVPGVSGDCGDLVMWFSSQVMGFEVDPTTNNSLSFARLCLDYWGRTLGLGFSSGFNPGSHIYMHKFRSVNVRRIPYYVFAAVNGASGIQDRHIMVVLPWYKSSYYALDLSRGSGCTFQPVGVRLNGALEWLAGRGQFTLLDLNGVLLPISDIIRPGLKVCTCIPAPGRY